MTMEWTRNDTIALALNNCALCRGLGLRIGKRGKASPCNCVLRGIFRVCYARFRDCASKEKHLSHCTLELTPGRERRFAWGRKDEEFCADFYLVTKRTLDEFEFKVFRYHFLLGADWRLCCGRLGLDRGGFFHLIYRIEQKLGRVFRELQPYGLYPLDSYFSAVVFSGPSMPARHTRVLPFRPPLQVPVADARALQSTA